VQAQKFREALDKAMLRYTNKAITAPNPGAGEIAAIPRMQHAEAKTRGPEWAAPRKLCVHHTIFGGRFQTYFRATAHALFLRDYRKNNLLLVFGHLVC
jgi:hypothetical protein